MRRLGSVNQIMGFDKSEGNQFWAGRARRRAPDQPVRRVVVNRMCPQDWAHFWDARAKPAEMADDGQDALIGLQRQVHEVCESRTLLRAMHLLVCID